jgi:hypothetical protein
VAGGINAVSAAGPLGCTGREALAGPMLAEALTTRGIGVADKRHGLGLEIQTDGPVAGPHPGPRLSVPVSGVGPPLAMMSGGEWQLDADLGLDALECERDGLDFVVVEPLADRVVLAHLLFLRGCPGRNPRYRGSVVSPGQTFVRQPCRGARFLIGEFQNNWPNLAGGVGSRFKTNQNRWEEITMFTRHHVAVAVTLLAASGAAANIFGSEVGADRLITIDMSTLTGADVGAYSNGSFNLTGLAANADTRQVYGLDAGSGRLFTVNADTGAANAITGDLFTGNANGLAYDANRDRLWVANNLGQVSFYDLGTGSSGLIGSTTLTNLEGLAYNAATDTLYAISDTDDRLYTLDTTTLAATAISDPLGDGDWRGLTYDSTSGRLVASRIGTWAVEFDLDFELIFRSGEIAGIGPFTQGLAYVPTPGTATMGFVGLGLVSMRRRREG